MNQPLQYTEIRSENRKLKRTDLKKTIKRKKLQKTHKVENMIESMHSYNDDSDNESLADFNPPPRPHIQSLKEPVAKEGHMPTETDVNSDNAVTKENFSEMNSNFAQQYYNNFVPYYTQTGNQQEIAGPKDKLLEKLNYMIHLLEEQKEEKTGHVTEELILYSFLGVFVIFVVDSFARVGKYIR